MMSIITQAYFLFISFLFFLLATVSAQPNDLKQATPRASITVGRSVITLGDLFNNTGKKSFIAVFKAPDPGKSGQISTLRLEKLAYHHGLGWRNDQNLVSVTVKRASRLITPEEIQKKVEDFIKKEVTQTPGTHLLITLQNNQNELHLPTEKMLSFNAEKFRMKTKTNFTVEIIAREKKKVILRRSYYGKVIETVPVPVLAQNTASKTLLKENHIRIQFFPRYHLSPNIIRDMNEIIGKITRRMLSAGLPLRRTDIEKRKLVKRGNIVTIMFRSPGLMIRTQGQSMNDGSIGDTLKVINNHSRRIIKTTVIGPGVVTVSPSAMNHATLR
ncbi:MAG: flagellar basal body P-ring formation chaperone FlgA [Alphaproteobacteria bacterium]|nr:flagellar basal body P-ring formation chaperone FlgA [Alphaproteobacteria bacterium]